VEQVPDLPNGFLSSTTKPLQPSSKELKPESMYPNLKLQLWKSGIRQNRLAQLLGMDETMLSRVVNGYREPNEKLRLAIAGILRCEEGWLFEAAAPPENGVPGIAEPARESK